MQIYDVVPLSMWSVQVDSFMQNHDVMPPPMMCASKKHAVINLSHHQKIKLHTQAMNVI